MDDEITCTHCNSNHVELDESHSEDLFDIYYCKYCMEYFDVEYTTVLKQKAS
jgi:transposase-like protein